MRNMKSLSIWAPSDGTLWQPGFCLFLLDLLRAGVRLTHVGIHIFNDDDPNERRLLGELLSLLTRSAIYLPFLKTLDASADPMVICR